jgi:hypothetical protein
MVRLRDSAAAAIRRSGALVLGREQALSLTSLGAESTYLGGHCHFDSVAWNKSYT